MSTAAAPTAHNLTLPVIDPQHIVNIARSTLKTPYKHQGRHVGVGLDCIGVAAVIAQNLGLPYIDRVHYSRLPSNGELLGGLIEQPCLHMIEPSLRQPGDVVLMRFDTEPQHVAIDCGETVIHCYSTVGEVVEHRWNDDWLGRIVHVFRFKVLDA